MLHFGVWLKKAAMEITNFLTLPDGRRLAYAEFGDPNGHPVLYFHGAPSSRLEEIQMPLVWFHGEQDRNVPIALIKQVTASLPTIQFIPCPLWSTGR
jgi:pimeloyl-ACP methyl ester carboxylesterase